MAGRYRMSRRYYDEPRGPRDGPYSRYPREQRPISPRRTEEELASRRDEMRRVHDDNRLLMDEIVGLRREIPLVKEDIDALRQALPKLRAEKELELRGLTQMNLKLEAELRSMEPVRQEALQLRSEAENLHTLKEEISAKVQDLSKDLNQIQSENQQILALKADRDELHQELIQARMAYDYEKKAKPELMGQVQSMEKDLVSLAQEAEKLRAEIERRQLPSVGGLGTYGTSANPGTILPGMYDDGYGSERSRYRTGPWPLYDSHSYQRR